MIATVLAALVYKGLDEMFPSSVAAIGAFLIFAFLFLGPMAAAIKQGWKPPGGPTT